MNNWCMKLFRRLLSPAILSFLVIYRKNIGQKIDHIKFMLGLVECLLEKCLVQLIILGHRLDDGTIKKLSEWHFPRRIPPTEKTCESIRQCVVCSKHYER
jgi:hypothetical protein